MREEDSKVYGAAVVFFLAAFAALFVTLGYAINLAAIIGLGASIALSIGVLVAGLCILASSAMFAGMVAEHYNNSSLLIVPAIFGSLALTGGTIVMAVAFGFAASAAGLSAAPVLPLIAGICFALALISGAITLDASRIVKLGAVPAFAIAGVLLTAALTGIGSPIVVPMLATVFLTIAVTCVAIKIRISIKERKETLRAKMTTDIAKIKADIQKAYKNGDVAQYKTLKNTQEALENKLRMVQDPPSPHSTRALTELESSNPALPKSPQSSNNSSKTQSGKIRTTPSVKNA